MTNGQYDKATEILNSIDKLRDLQAIMENCDYVYIRGGGIEFSLDTIDAETVCGLRRTILEFIGNRITKLNTDFSDI